MNGKSNNNAKPNNEIVIKAWVMEEEGYVAAIQGLSLSYQVEWGKANRVAERLAGKDGGHNKFLESIQVWIQTTAPRYWWQEADTYRLSTKQSESTMHTLMKALKEPQGGWADLFEDGSCTVGQWVMMREAAARGDLITVKKLLPEGFLQTRVWNLSYKTLRNIILQRQNHRLPHWRAWIAQVLAQVRHPELLPNPFKEAGDVE